MDNVVLRIDNHGRRRVVLYELQMQIGIVETAGWIYDLTGNLDLRITYEVVGRHIVGHGVPPCLYMPRPVNMVVPAKYCKEIAGTISRFGGTKKEIATRLQRKMYRLHYPLLSYAIEVDKHVAASHQVNMREGGAFENIRLRKQNHFSDFPADAVIVVLLVKKAQ